jgi:CCR4-NOT transcription complex subunit 3
MEKFKACEKEMKTKAFSKEGLTAATKLDPKAQEKIEVTAWIQSQVEELQIQIEQSEAEIETLQGGGRRKASRWCCRRTVRRAGTPKRAAEMACQPPGAHHATAGQRFISGGQGAGPPRRRDIFRRIKYGVYAISNFDVRSHFSFQDENFEEYEGIYDELNLNEEEEKFGLAQEEAESSDSEDTSEGRACAGSTVRLKFTFISQPTYQLGHHCIGSLRTTQ